MRRGLLVCVLVALGLGHSGGFAAAGVVLVEDGKAVGVIVLPEKANPLVKDAAQVFARTVERSTGATIPIITEKEVDTLEAGKSRLFLGACQANLAKGLDPFALEGDSWRRLTAENEIHLIGAEKSTSRTSPDGRPYSWVSRPTLWALNRILEEQLQVRWLWPGDLGTVVPRHRSLTVPEGEIKMQAKLFLRSLRFPASRPLVFDAEAEPKNTSGGGALGRGSWSGTARRYPVWTCFLRVVGKVLEGSSGLLRLSG